MFSLSPAAVKEIRSRLDSSGLKRAAISLLDSTDALPTSPEMVSAIERNASEAEMLELAKREYGQGPDHVFWLAAGIYEEHRCRPEDLRIVDGIQFAIVKEMYEYFSDYVLDYAEGRFRLESGDRIYLRLIDLPRQDRS